MKGRNVLFSRGRWHCCIAKQSYAGAVEKFAVSELRRYLRRITGRPIRVKEEATGPAIRVGREFARHIEDVDSLGSNGLAIQSQGEDIIIASCGEKGVLNGVYEFLEILGCRWYYPGSGEIVPKVETLSVTDLNVRMRPSFSIITFFQDYRGHRDYSVEEMKAVQQENDHALLDWMGKNKMNAIMGTALSPSEERRERRKRALSKEFGGHVIPTLLPRSLFENHPEYFPVGRDGKRNREGNVCCSNKAALKVVQRNAVKMAKRSEGIVFHVWGRDVAEGAWCSCENCRDVSIQAQYMRVVNAVAEAVEKVRPDIRVACIAYYDTLLPDVKVKPRPNVILLFAPRSRCYGHVLNSVNCEINSEIYLGLKKYMEIFGEKKAATFEYFGDSLLYCSVAASIPWIVGADMKEYFRLGVGGAGCLMFGGYTWWAHPLNLYVFAKMAFDIETNVEDLMLDYVRNMFPSASGEMFAYYRDLEKAVGLLLRFSDWRYRMARQEPKEDLTSKVGEVLSGIEELQVRLERLSARLTGQENQRLQRERSILEVTRLLVGSLKSSLLGKKSLMENDFKEALLHFGKEEEDLEEMMAYLMMVDPQLRGSWGYPGQGENERVKTYLLQRIRKQREELNQQLRGA